MKNRIPYLLAEKVMEKVKAGETILRVGTGELFPELPINYNFLETDKGLYLVEHAAGKTLSSLLFGTKENADERELSKFPHLPTFEAVLDRFSWLGLRKNERLYGGIFLALHKLSLVSGPVEKEIYFDVQSVKLRDLESALEKAKEIAKYSEITFTYEILKAEPRGKTCSVYGKITAKDW